MAYLITTLAGAALENAGAFDAIILAAAGLIRLGFADRIGAALEALGLPRHLPEDVALPAQYESLVKVLETVIDDLGRLYEGVEKRYDDAGWVGYRFAEILPIAVEQKQQCLEIEDPLERLQMMRKVLKTVRGVGYVLQCPDE